MANDLCFRGQEFKEGRRQRNDLKCEEKQEGKKHKIEACVWELEMKGASFIAFLEVFYDY